MSYSYPDDLPQSCYAKWDKMNAEIAWLKQHAKAEFDRGLKEGESKQAILEIQARERFLEELRAEREKGGW